MKVIFNVGQIKKNYLNTVLAIGVFDGLHIGHQALIKEAVKKAKSIGAMPVVFTFYPHPVRVINPEKYMPFISSLSDRLKLIKSLGVSVCFVIKFTKRFSNIVPETFVKRYIVDKFHPKEIFVGDDFRFGKNREGCVKDLIRAGNQNGFKVNNVKLVKGKGRKVGSSQIRELIFQGKLGQAKILLGRYVSVEGRVIRGESRGRILGYPTANIKPGNEIIIPKGVYAVRTLVGKKEYNGMANVGVRPSFDSSNKNLNIEIHLFEFNKNIYGRKIIVEFVRRIRDEKKFSNFKELVSQLRKDELKSRAVLTALN